MLTARPQKSENPIACRKRDPFGAKRTSISDFGKAGIDNRAPLAGRKTKNNCDKNSIVVDNNGHRRSNISTIAYYVER